MSGPRCNAPQVCCEPAIFSLLLCVARELSNCLVHNDFQRGRKSVVPVFCENVPAIDELQRACLSCIKTGIAFIDENGGGPGVRLGKKHQKKS
jgi:hypothetical protein